MNMQQMKTEIIGILQFEAEPMAPKEIRQAPQLSGEELDGKLFANAITSMLTAGTLNKIEADDLGKNRYRYALAQQPAGEPAPVVSQKPQKMEHKPSSDSQTEHKPTVEQAVKNKPMLEDKILYMVECNGINLFDDIDQAKKAGESLAAKHQKPAEILELNATTIGFYRPTINIEFVEVNP